VTDTVRASFLLGYDELAREVGLDPLGMLERVGIPRAALTDPDLRVPTVAARDLLEASARDAEDFGLRMSELRTPSIMGPVALVLRDQPTLREILKALARYIDLHSEGTQASLEEREDIATLGMVLRYPAPGSARQGTELAMGQFLRILRTYLGPAWQPLSSSFLHSAPRSLGTHQRIFGPNVVFDQDFNGFVFKRGDLDRPNPAADPAMAREVERYVTGLAVARRASPPERVGQLVEALLPMGLCTIQFIARQLGVDQRTLRRRLADHGTSLAEIVQSARMTLVLQYLEQSDRPLAEVADVLGFSSLSAFSRWHKTHYGQSASAHREAAHDRKAP